MLIVILHTFVLHVAAFLPVSKDLSTVALVTSVLLFSDSPVARPRHCFNGNIDIPNIIGVTRFCLSSACPSLPCRYYYQDSYGYFIFSYFLWYSHGYHRQQFFELRSNVHNSLFFSNTFLFSSSSSRIDVLRLMYTLL